MSESVTINVHSCCQSSGTKSGRSAGASHAHGHQGAAQTASQSGLSAAGGPDTGVRLYFQGLCAIVDRDFKGEELEVYLHPGDHHGGHAHVATLTARIRDVNWSDTNFWEPTSLGVDGNGDQIGLWVIEPDSELTIGNGAKSWLARTRGIDLRVFHPSARTKPKATILHDVRGISLITLTGGEMTAHKERPVNPMLAGKEFPGHYMTGTVWHTDVDYTLVHSNGQSITFKDGSRAAISNVAMVKPKDGRQHFKHYYDLIEGVTDQITLGDVQADEDVYDCVPPVPTPGP